jgi:hypothetical protein
MTSWPGHHADAEAGSRRAAAMTAAAAEDRRARRDDVSTGDDTSLAAVSPDADLLVTRASHTADFLSVGKLPETARRQTHLRWNKKSCRVFGARGPGS